MEKNEINFNIETKLNTTGSKRRSRNVGSNNDGNDSGVQDDNSRTTYRSSRLYFYDSMTSIINCVALVVWMNTYLFRSLNYDSYKMVR